MKDLAYVFTLCFITLGPLKTIPAFFLATHSADRRTILILAAKSTVLATLIVLFMNLVASGTLMKWRVSLDALAIAGGLVLLVTSVKTLSGFSLIETPERAVEPAAPASTRWMGRPVLSPLVIPGIIPPVGVVVILYFAGLAVEDMEFQARLVGLLLAIMATNFVSMLFAGPIMRRVGVPVLQVVGWVFSALKAGLAMQILINALRHLMTATAVVIGLALLSAPAAAGTLPCRPADSSRPGVGLVLSGGGARGAAHVGVLRVLEELQIPIDCVAGTSMGAVVGGFYAAGWSPDEIERELLAIDWGELFRGEAPRRRLSYRRKEDDLRYIDFDAGLRNAHIVLPRGAVASPVLDFLLRSKTLGVASIDDFDRLPIPFRAVAADLASGEEVVLARGELSRAIRASMSIPGVFSPIEIENYLLVDGAVLNNMPVEAAEAMGAEIIIAVDASTPLRGREGLGSIGGVTSQAFSLASQRRVEEQKQQADILITPDLGAISFMGFPAMKAAMQSGEIAARGVADRLRPLANAPVFAMQQASRRYAEAEAQTLRSVRVEGTERVDERRVRGRIESRVGAHLDLDRLREDLGRVLEIGEFDRVDLDLTRDEDGVDLSLRPHDNDWGPLYLRGGLNITDDLEGHNSVNMLFNVTRTSVNALGAEWRNEFQVGKTRGIWSELYQPLGFSRRWFVAAGVRVREEVADVYLDHRKVAEYDVGSVSGRLDFGLELGEYGEVRLGLLRGRADAEPSVGATDLPSFDVDAGGFAGSLTIDRLDSAGVPREGKLVRVEAYRTEPRLGSDLRYDKLAGYYWHFASKGRQTWLLALSGGSSLGSDLPAYDEFLLGGPFSLSGYRQGELRGHYFGVARSGYLFRLAELPRVLGTGVYAGGWLEAGNVWQESSAVGDGLIYTASLAAAAETRLGLLFMGYGVADDGQDSFFLSLGQRF